MLKLTKLIIYTAFICTTSTALAQEKTQARYSQTHINSDFKGGVCTPLPGREPGHPHDAIKGPFFCDDEEKGKEGSEFSSVSEMYKNGFRVTLIHQTTVIDSSGLRIKVPGLIVEKQ